MTEEEMAEEYLDKRYLKDMGVRNPCKEAFLAGLKTGKDINVSTKWHKVADGDLPKEQQLVLLYRENPHGANVALTYWFKSYVNDKVIAWCEIPKYTDKE